MSVYPCLDENHRYRSFPCSQCIAASCWMGSKPKPPASHRPVWRNGERLPLCQTCGLPVRPNTHGNVPLTHSDCEKPRLCRHCHQPFTPTKGSQVRYCCDDHRYQEMMRLRRIRRADRPREAGRVRKASTYRNRFETHHVPRGGQNPYTGQ